MLGRQIVRGLRGQNGLCRGHGKVTAAAATMSTMADAFYNAEQKELQSTTRKVIESQVNPFADEWEKQKSFPAHQVFKKFGEAGLLGINKPVEYGGMGLDYKYQMAFAEALGECRATGVTMAVGVQVDMSTPALSKFGSDQLRRDFLAPAIAGDVVTSVAVSEPGGGSDVAACKTTAVRKGDDLVINGQKMWITNSLQADWMCVLCNTSEGKPHANKSLVIVPMDRPGIVKAKRIEKMGMHCSDTGLIFFEDVRVPASNIIGQEGMGFTYQMMQFQEERLVAAAGSIAPLSIAIKETIEYLKQRKAFGQPLINNQYIHFRLAELQTEVELLRAMLYQTADAMVRGEDVTMYASMLKLKSGRLAREVTDACVQFWGGMGYSDDVYVSRLYRDLRLYSIGGGADEVMLGIICKLMGILPKPPKK